MEITITKKDVYWSYFAQVFTLASGFLILPLILHKLSADEVGMNYLMLTIGTLVNLFDFGLSSQFGRNITYVLSGAKQLSKKGFCENEKGSIDNHLLAAVIETAKYIYKRLSLIVLLFMLTIGTAYIYHVTDGFSNVQNSLLIWIVYSISTYFNLYFIYYSSLLNGTAQVMESKKAILYSKIAYVALCYLLVCTGFGLLGVVVANLLAPFVNRYFSYHYFYNEEMKSRLSNQTVSKAEIKDIFFILWYNAKRLGLNFVGAYCITQSGIFIAGLFLPLKEVGSYGLMVQVFSVISGLSCALFRTYQPKFNKYCAEGDKDNLVKDFSFTMIAYYGLHIVGGLLAIFVGPSCLELIKSESTLPSTIVMVVYFIDSLMEQNHSIFASIIVSGNKVPFVGAALYSGFAILLLVFISLKFTNYGLLGIVVTTMICQTAYNHWRWPKWVLDDIGVNYFTFLKIGVKECRSHVYKLLKR